MAGIFDALLGGTDVGSALSPKRGRAAPALDPGEARSLALVNALGGVQEAGLQRTATPMGSIAQNLIPIFAALIQAKAYERAAAAGQDKTKLEEEKIQSEIERNRAQAKKAGTAEQPKTLQQLAVDRILAGKPYDDVVTANKQMQKPSAPTEAGLLMGKLRGDPESAAGFDALEKQKDRRAQMAAGIAINKSIELSTLSDQRKTQQRLDSPAVKQPEYRQKVLVDRNNLKEAPTGIPTRDVEAEGSPWIALSTNEGRTLRGAKQISQQLDRLEQLVPEVLPESRLGLPITLSQQAIQDKPGAKASEFDRIASFEQLKGIRDFLASGRINQAEIKNVGKLDRLTDNRSRALAKIKAMRDLVSGTLGAMNLNPDALAPQQKQIMKVEPIP